MTGALAKETLKDVLDVLRDCTALAQDIQLKILQILPSLVQNYAGFLAGDFLATALHICFLLFASKPAVIANTAAATLQQLAVSAFGKLALEDEVAGEPDVVAEVPIEDGSVSVRSAASDAYRLFNDICLMTEGHSPSFLYPASMPQNFGLEILEAILANYADTVSSHPEVIHVIRLRLMPFIIRVLSERVMFSTTVRAIRLLPLIFGHLLSVLPTECEMVLGLLNHMLDPDAAVLWKRVLCMEVFRGLHAEAALVRSIYGLFDEQDGKRSIIQDHMGLLVRLASEKPAVIGLGQQSSVPASSGQTEDEIDEMAALQADGVAGTFGVAMTLRASTAPGISTRLSTMRVSCLDQLDKNEPPPIPPAYLYTLALICMNSFAEGLARFLLPFTIRTDVKAKKSQKPPPDDEGSGTPAPREAAVRAEGDSKARTPSPASARLPINPLSLIGHVLYHQIQTSARMANHCWPALLAAYSTFFHAALDAEYFHALVRSFQKFTQICGLLELSTPRDAFLTALGKNAVPSGLISVSTSLDPTAVSSRHARHGSRSTSDKDPVSGTLSAIIDKGKWSVELGRASLNTRNLLCLRALLNLGIALGPVLQKAWSIVLETLQAAESIIHHVTSQRRQARSGQASGSNDTDILGDIGNEIAAVRVAASRMLESSTDLPDAAFLDVVHSLCALLKLRESRGPVNESSASTTSTPKTHTPTSSISRKPTHMSLSDPRANLFVVESLEKVSDVNSARLLRQSPLVSGWRMIVDPMIEASGMPMADLQLRSRAAGLVCALVESTASTNPDDALMTAFREDGLRALETLIASLYKHQYSDKASRFCELDMHNAALETLKSLLEQCGDSLARGWDQVFLIIATVFNPQSIQTSADEPPNEQLMAKSPKLVRSSFGSLQLVCSDFLPSVPSSYLPRLLRTMHSFCRQRDDFNIALTSTTLFGNVSDHLQTVSPATAHERERNPAGSPREEQIPVNDLLGLLLLLVNVTIDGRLEVRHSAIHSVFAILEAWASRIPPPEWMALLDRVLLTLLACNIDRCEQLVERGDQLAQLSDWNEAAVLMLAKASDLLVTHVGLLAHQDAFGPFWEKCLGHLRQSLGREDLKLSAAVYECLEHVLSAFQTEPYKAFTHARAAWELWKDGNPADHRNISQTMTGNQPALLAYLRCLSNLQSLMGDGHVERIRSMLNALQECATKGQVTTTREDVDRSTSVQSEVLACIRNVDPMITGVASELISSVSSLIGLAYDEDFINESGPTYIAFSKAAMDVLGSLNGRCGQVQDIYESGSFVTALRTLESAIARKYRAPLAGKDPRAWRKATTTCVSIMEDSLPHLAAMDIDTHAGSIWEQCLACLRSIVHVDAEICKVAKDAVVDQDLDIEAFHKVHQLLVPALGRAKIPDRLRQSFAAMLFETSLIHEPHPDDLPRAGADILSNLASTHIGRVKRPCPARRSRVSYVLLGALFDLVACHDGSDERVRLAQAAAPFLILRVSLPLKSYVLDQPLRGRMPLAASQRNELFHILAKLVALDCEPRALPDGSPQRHLHWVYGLVREAIGVARRDQGLHSALARVLEVVGNEFETPQVMRSTFGLLIMDG